MAKLISEMWTHDPSARPSAATCAHTLSSMLADVAASSRKPKAVVRRTLGSMSPTGRVSPTFASLSLTLALARRGDEEVEVACSPSGEGPRSPKLLWGGGVSGFSSAKKSMQSLLRSVSFSSACKDQVLDRPASGGKGSESSPDTATHWQWRGSPSASAGIPEPSGEGPSGLAARSPTGAPYQWGESGYM